MTPINFGQKLREIRGEMSQKEFAGKIAPGGLCPVTTLINWEVGHREPSPLSKWLIIKRLEWVYKMKVPGLEAALLCELKESREEKIKQRNEGK